MSIEFLITSLIVVLAPGTGALYTLAIAITQGHKASFIAAFACTLGIIPHLAASIFGLAAILHTSALLFETVKYIGVAYLLYLAWQTLRGNGAISLETDPVERKSFQSILTTGFLINILNPKLSIFFLAFLPQFLSFNSINPTFEMLSLGLVFMSLTLTIFMIYGFFAAQLSQYLLRQPNFMKWFSRSVAAAFAALGLKLAFADR